jgi:hypothetical protein
VRVREVVHGVRSARQAFDKPQCIILLYHKHGKRSAVIAAILYRTRSSHRLLPGPRQGKHMISHGANSHTRTKKPALGWLHAIMEDCYLHYIELGQLTFRR